MPIFRICGVLVDFWLFKEFRVIPVINYDRQTIVDGLDELDLDDDDEDPETHDEILDEGETKDLSAKEEFEAYVKVRP